MLCLFNVCSILYIVLFLNNDEVFWRPWHDSIWNILYGFLGHVGNSSAESGLTKSKDVGGFTKITSSSSSTSGSSKKARAINNGTQIVSSLADGCQADLSNYRGYHMRHKVCKLHSKTSQVTLGGHKQRFFFF
ncbi:putative transcription factor SBP family [Medicago truncatula]|uniref:Putative transcription factor SBP family n=1 Tax=Medicago truncatula TaxID=3880 RepID=A0A396GKC5_MEDTR|nr:putative transcription factor SBP family [Medicago truncatula]